MRPGNVGQALAGTRFQAGNILRRLGPSLRLPAESLEGFVVFRQLDGGITVVLGVVVIMDALDIAVLEGGVNHLGLHLVHRGQGIVFFQIKERCGASKGIKAGKGRCGIEVRHYLGSANLVESLGGFFNGDEGIGQQMGPLHLAVFDDHVDAVGSILPIPFVEENRVLVQAHQGIQVCVGEGVSGHLHVPAEEAHALGAPDEIHLGGIRRRRCGVQGRPHSLGRSLLGLLLFGRRLFPGRFFLLLLPGLACGIPLPQLAGIFLGNFLRIVLLRLGRFLGRFFGRLLAVFHHRVSGNVLEALRGILHP